jgi:glycosyltransferase involved in cell wall biosynthesis
MDFSVLLPTYNRRQTLEKVLAAWELEAPAELSFELVVVDDGSTDGSAELLASLRPSRFPLRFARQENSGPAAARNRAIGLARGEYVLFTGDDIEPRPDLLARHLAAHRDRPQAGRAILGLTRWPPGEKLTATMRHVDGVGAQQFSYHYLEDGAVYDFRHFYTSNVSLSRAFLRREPQLFSTAFPAAAFEDAEFAHRLAFHGLEIVYRREAEAFHHHAYGARSFYRRQHRCGQMAAVLAKLHPSLEKWLSSEDLRRRRLELIGAPAEVEDLGRARERAIELAETWDEADPPGIDDLLLALFRYAYLEGLGQALFGQAAEKVLASFFADLMPPAIAAFDRRLRAAGAALPHADLQAFAALARGS